ncbi:MAG: ABC transporter substrate-binding protein [Angelakisella sp.]
MFKRILATVLATSMLLIATACGNSSKPSSLSPSDNQAQNPSASATGSEPITIEFWYAFGSTVEENTKRLVKEFNESQDKIVVKAEYQGGSYNDLHTKVQSAFAAKNPPAVTLNEITVVKNFAVNGMTQPLDPYIAKDNFDMSDFIPGLLSNTQVDGKTYGLPYLRSTPLVFYNATLFEQAGLGKEAPKTMDEMLEYSRKLTKGEVVGLSTPMTTWTYEALVDSYGGRFLNEDETKATFNSPEAMKAMAFYQTGLKEKVFKITTGGDASSQAKLEFQNQRSAMILGSTADLTYYMQVAKETGFELGVGFIPNGGEGSVPTGGANLVMVNGISDEQAAAAWEFMKFVTSKEQTAKSSVATGYLPARISAKDDAEMQKVYSEKPLFRVAVDQLETAVPRPMAKNFPKVNSLLLDALTKCILDPSADAQAIMDAAVKESDALLAK